MKINNRMAASMASRKNRERQEPKSESTPPPVAPAEATDAKDVRPPKRHLRCPSCWTGYGGRAERMKWSRQVSGILQKRCYVCDQCGTEWVVEVRCDTIDDIEHKTTKVVEVRHDEA